MGLWTQSNVSAAGCENWVTSSQPLAGVQPCCGGAFRAAQDAEEYQASSLSTSHLPRSDRRHQEE